MKVTPSLSSLCLLKHCRILVVLISSLLIACELQSGRQGPIIQNGVVKSEQGAIEGNYDDGLAVFKGIPYAAPPLHDLRWSAPKPPLKRGEVLRATEYGPACLQAKSRFNPIAVMSEDCLTLNIWAPSTSTKKLPVMVWVHGGGFVSGSGVMRGSSLAREDVVLVSFNYRLGPLGFFSHSALNNDVANFGLLDSVAALSWVQDNIEQFGGDPDNVTIFGVSAGGMMVNMLLASEQASGLFHKAIAQSGYGSWPLPRSAGGGNSMQDIDGKLIPSAEKLADKLIANLIDAPINQEVLRDLDGKDIIANVRGFMRPIVDGVTLKAEPSVLFEQGEYNKVPVISGANSYDGSIMRYSGVSLDAYEAGWKGQLEEVKEGYAADFSVSRDLGLSRVFGDERYLLSAWLLGKSNAQQGVPAWLYFLDFVPESELPSNGTGHGADTRYLFATMKSDDESSINVSRRLRTYWANFARFGTPNGNEAEVWPVFSSSTQQWLTIGKTDKPQAIKAIQLPLLEKKFIDRQ